MLISLYENVKFLHFICLLKFSYISEFQLPSSLERSEVLNSEKRTRKFRLPSSLECGMSFLAPLVSE